MRRQRNMAQMKEENKTLENELNEMEANNLSDTKFEALLLRMLKELSANFNKKILCIKKDIETIKKKTGQK